MQCVYGTAFDSVPIILYSASLAMEVGLVRWFVHSPHLRRGKIVGDDDDDTLQRATGA